MMVALSLLPSNRQLTNDIHNSSARVLFNEKGFTTGAFVQLLPKLVHASRGERFIPEMQGIQG